jgi:hypothetical protein
MISLKKGGEAMNLYLKPVLKSEKLSLYSNTQYDFLLTTEDCPGLQIGPFIGLQGNNFLTCSTLPSAQNGGDTSIAITCSNISGTFNAVTHASQAFASSGLNCVGQTETIAIPFSLSPELPADCVVDTFVLTGSGNLDLCDSQT